MLYRGLSLFFALLIVGCAHAPRETIGTTVEGRPIQSYHFGSGPRRVLILGAIHGNETSTAYVTQQLTDLLNHQKIPCDLRLIPVANPDGFARKIRTNARQVDLNRNFPASNWKTVLTPGYATGKSPLSEPESKALHDLIESFKPNVIVSIHSIGQNRECNNFDGPGESIARLMAQHNHYRVTPTIGYPTPGSLGSFAADHHLAMVTLELPSGQSGQDAWNNNREALLAVLNQ